MSNKDSNKSKDQILPLKSQSPTSKTTLFKEVSNNNVNINTSFDQIKKEDQKLKRQNSSNMENPVLQQTQKTDLHKKKAQALKALKNIEKQQKQIKVKLQKSIKKLPEIRQSPSNKQNLPSDPINKKQTSSLHLRTQADNQSSIVRANKNHHPVESNYSVVNGIKVFMSEDDVAKLKKLKLQYKKRQQQIKKKVVAHQMFIEKMKTQQIVSKEKQVEEKRQKRLKSIEDRQKILSKERLQKNQRFQEENRKLKELKQSKKLFQKMEENYHKIQQKQKINLNQMIKSRVGQGTVNYDQIKQHQKEYLEKNKQNIQKSRIRIKSKIKEVQQEFNHLNLHKSQFYERVKNQKKYLLHEMEEKQRKRKVCSQKVKEYKEIVRQNYMPTVVKVQKLEYKKKPCFNFSQIHSMGNDFMKQGGKLIDRNKSLNHLQKFRKEQAERTNKKTYKNYLHQNRTEASPKQNSKSHSKPEQALIDRELKSINAIKNPKQKYEKIKLLHNKIQKDLKSSMQVGGKIKLRSGNTQANLENEKHVKQIKAKLQLLEGLES